MKKITFGELAKKVLEEEKKPLSATDIWEIAKIKGYDKLLHSQGKTLSRQLKNGLIDANKDMMNIAAPIRTALKYIFLYANHANVKKEAAQFHENE